MMENMQTSPKYKIWLLAARPKTLPAAAAPVVMGSVVALYENVFNAVPAITALLAALLLQVGANFANDLFDHRRGADSYERLGPLRVTQAGLLTEREMISGMWVVFGLAAVLGLYLVITAGWGVLLIGVASILAALAYTGGPYPLGYYGLGDITVFLFFGPVAVCGTFFVQAGYVSELAAWASIPIGALITAILVVNNLRDMKTDRAAGKKTLAVKIGVRGTRVEYLLLLLSALIVPVGLVILGLAPAWYLLPLVSLPYAFRLNNQVRQNSGRELNQTLAHTGLYALIYALLFGFGYLVWEILAI